MADKLMRAQVTIPMDGALPEDYITNTFHFDGDDVNETDAAYHSAVMSKLTTFYQAIDGVIFPAQVATPAVVKIYDMRDAVPRVPEFTGSIVLTPTANNMYPGEVALCVSFAAEPQSGVNPQRLRGRMYLGPLSSTESTIVAAQNRPNSGLLTLIASAADALITPIALPVTGQVRLAIYSPKTDETSTIDDAFNDVVTGWVDDAWDTQRRRGPKPTTRVTFAA